MKPTTRQKFLLFSLAILSVVLLLSYASYKSNKKALDSSKLVENTELIISKTDFILSIGKDIETGSKGFIITNDSEFLEPLNTARKTIFSYISELKEISKDNPQQQLRIDSLDVYIHKFLDFSLKSVAIRSKQGLAPAILFTATKEGKQYMDRVRRICSDIQAEESRLLIIRKQANEKFLAQANRYSLLIVLLRILLTAIVLIATGSYLIKRNEKEKLAAEIVQQKISKHREITEAVISAHERERSEIGKELHENINQLLATSKLYNEMANKGGEDRASFLAASTDYTKMAIEEVRKLSKELVTPLMEDIGLIKSINSIAEDIMKVNPMTIEISAKGFNEKIFSQKFKLNLFRIVQVQVNNTLKHAKASTLKIGFSQMQHRLSVVISDDGVGFDTTLKSNGVGIKNIVSRAELYKGEVTIKSAPGHGFSMNITFDNADILHN